MMKILGTLIDLSFSLLALVGLIAIAGFGWEPSFRLVAVVAFSAATAAYGSRLKLRE